MKFYLNYYIGCNEKKSPEYNTIEECIEFYEKVSSQMDFHNSKFYYYKNDEWRVL